MPEDFAGFTLVDEAPGAVVIGDLYTEFAWQRLNRLFQMVLDGARLVALHKNRYCRCAEGLSLDVGPFAAALPGIWPNPARAGLLKRALS